MPTVMSRNEEKHKFTKFLTSENTVKGLFIGSIASISALVSFSFALSSAKKKDNTVYDSTAAELHVSGTKLAFRALKWGTFFAVSGCSLIIFSVWKIANVKDMEEFRHKMGSILPAVPKNDPPQSRTEFGSITEFLQYLDDEYSPKKQSISDISKEKEFSNPYSSS